MKKGMNISTFLRLVNVEVEKFKETWEYCHQRNQAVFPAMMDEKGWWEEFHRYFDNKGKKTE